MPHIIPFGTLIRVSLARWWTKNGETEKRCWLQLSGWYELPEIQTYNPVYEFDGYVPDDYPDNYVPDDYVQF